MRRPGRDDSFLSDNLSSPSTSASSSVSLSPHRMKGAGDPLQSQMVGLQSRVAMLGKQINDMYVRADSAATPPTDPPPSHRTSVATASVMRPPGSTTYASSLARASQPAAPLLQQQQQPARPGSERRPASTYEYRPTGSYGSPGAPRSSTAPYSPSMMGTAGLGSGYRYGGPSADYGGPQARGSAYVGDMLQDTPMGARRSAAALGLGSRSAMGSLGARPGSAAPALGRVDYAGNGAGRVQQQEEERLKMWIQDLRHERRRLEDRLLSGDSQGMRTLDVRDDLEKQVMVLSRQRDALEAETDSMASMQQALHELSLEVSELRQALHAESESNGRQQAARAELEAELGELGRELQQLALQHEKSAEELGRTRDSLALKYKKAAQKLQLSEEGTERLRVELERVGRELQAKEAALGEFRASSEVLQAANSQLQAQLGSSQRGLEQRAAELQRQLDEQARELAAARQHAGQAGRDAAASETQVKELAMRADFLRAEREKLLKVLQAEQQQAASLRQTVEALQSQVRSVEGERVDLDSNARIQLEALQKQYDVQATSAQRQYEMQVSALDKQYAALQKQYDAAVQSHEKLLGIHNGLRKERDELWAEADRLRRQLSDAESERNEVVLKLNALRGEVKFTMDDVMQDREARIQSMGREHEQIVAELKVQYEAQLAEGEARLRGALELGEELRRQLAESQISEDKHRGVVVHLKEQLGEALVSRDTMQRDLEAEREFSRELNRIVNQIRGADAGARPMPRGSQY